METHFREWAKPGPVPPDADALPMAGSDETLDALSGHFRIFQPRHGHRFSTDDVLTAWYGTSWAPSATSVLDLGSGIGSVAMIAAWRLVGARVVTVEAHEDSVRLATRSAAYNGLTQRFDIRHADLRDPAALGVDERFDLVLGSPPDFPVGSGIESTHPQKAACRFELRGDIRDYAVAAARHLAPGGLFACVFPEGQRGRVERAAADVGMTIVRRRPVIFREGEPALISLFALTAALDLPPHLRNRTWLGPALVIRSTDGSVHPEYAALKLAVGFPP